MDDMRFPTAAIAAVSLALSAWLILHRLLIVLGFRRLHHGFSGGAEEANNHWLYSVDNDLCEQLIGLGFAPVGVYWEKMALSRTFLEIVFVSETDRSFAMLYPNHQIMPRRASFLTVFADGAVVHTKNYQGGLEGVTPTFVAGSPPSETNEDIDIRFPLEEVLSEHRKRLHTMIQADHTPMTGNPEGVFLEAQRKFHGHPFVSGLHRSADLFNLLTIICSLFAVPGLLAWYFGFTHFLPWSVLCLLTRTCG